ncbi:MAG: M1 family metallopeptidase [Clostridia bacterium]|nr:M1 family metallopeptidase [Clostridia bacterium]
MFKKTALILATVLIFTYAVVLGGCKKDENNRTTYEIDVSLSENHLVGSQTVNYYNDTDTTVKELKFNLFGNAFRKGAKYSPISPAHLSLSYPNGINYGGMAVQDVNSNGQSLEFEISGEDANILTVNLGEEIFPEERVVVSIDFTLDLANVVARTGINAHTINLANFYPILCARGEQGFYECVYYSNGDPFYSDCADYTVKITLDKNFVVASSGKLCSSIEKGELTTKTYKIDNARSFAFVCSKLFKSITKTVDEVEITYYYYDDLTPDKSLEYAVKSIDFFSERFGKYCYDHFSVVQTEFVQGGMEFPALVMISDDLEDKAYGEVIVHETAHQWWQTAVGNNEIEYGFLDEGLTEYSVVLFYENNPEYGMTREYMVKSAQDTYKVFCSVSDKVFGKVNTVMMRSLKDFNGEYEYVNIAYIKPCIMYDCLRESIGDAKFFKGLQKYYKEFKFKNATPYDLVGIYEKTGADSNGFFESFFDGKVIL